MDRDVTISFDSSDSRSRFVSDGGKSLVTEVYLDHPSSVPGQVYGTNFQKGLGSIPCPCEETNRSRTCDLLVPVKYYWDLSLVEVGRM